MRRTWQTPRAWWLSGRFSRSIVSTRRWCLTGRTRGRCQINGGGVLGDVGEESLRGFEHFARDLLGGEQLVMLPLDGEPTGDNA